ncbi:hypothetical protein [Lysinibacillus sphaericus]|uniref:hypothetical protein n=1 Tax=Lysinibacillus sphaericus TaxID=1421 RepID=UPI003D024270
MNDTTQKLPSTEYYRKWIGEMDAKLMCLKNSRGEFLIDKVNNQILKYLNNNCLECVWNNHLLLIALIETERNKDVKSILLMLGALHTRFKDIFTVFELTTFLDFDADIHLYEYLKGSVLSNSTNNMRRYLLSSYKGALKLTNKWLSDYLSVEEQVYFSQYLLQSVFFDSGDFTFGKLAKEEAQATRKDETDAIVPHLPKIRAEANFRWNQMKRLRDAFHQQIKKVENESLSLPIEFYYDEPERIGERFYLRLWDKPSFVMNHQTEFSDVIIKQATQRKVTYSNENNAYFLEFIRAESLVDDSEAEGFWFNELIERNVIGRWNKYRPIDEHDSILNFLSLWGYERENKTYPTTFESNHKGVLTPSTFVTKQKDKAKGLLIDVEPFYVACTFGLLAIDILTTTGARKNELLQINNTRKCIDVKTVNNKQYYSFYTVPKGRNELEEFYLSKQTMEHILTVLDC